jgi:hypothetical protein
MARKKRPHRTSPKTPSRVKKRRARKPRGEFHIPKPHPELVGLGLVGAGIFIAAVLWFGFSGGPVAHAVKAAVGAAAYLAPLVLVPLGALMVTRTELVDVRPFRLGLGVALTGLLLTLGDAHGGAVGNGLERAIAVGLGTTGATILGVLLTIAGVTFLTGTSLGALLRHTGHVVHLAHKRVRSFQAEWSDLDDGGYPAREEAFHPPVDVKHDYPDLMTDSVSVGPPPVLYDAATEEKYEDDDVHESQEQLFPTLEPVGEYELPDRNLLKKSKAGAGPNGEASQRVAEALVTCLAHFGVEATVIGQNARPRDTRYE